jgi:small-conductance mechanosensitive channel
MATLVERLNHIMVNQWKIKESVASYIDEILAFAAIILAALIINWICQTIARWILKRCNSRVLKVKNLARNILLLIPGIVLYFLIGYAFGENGLATSIMSRVDIIFIIIVIMMICNSALLSILDDFLHSGRRKNVPLQGLVQALQVIIYFVGSIIIIAVIFDKSLGALLTGLGASAAVLMLVFKDSILGFVAGVQLSQNKMIQIGDWIQLPDGSANGTVEEITLNTVKVRNWDNTVSMVPPYTLVSSPFKNWRGMQESGGRRADKMIYIDVNSMEECNQDMINDMIKSFPLLKDKLQGEPEKGDDRLTNAQVYRTYIFAYLKQHPYVNASLDIIVTQKEATPYGMPIEVYFFTREKDWALHEKQQSDIFDHLMTIAPDFGLRLYQRP